MSSMLSSQGVVLATAMAAVSGTIILLAFRLQKSIQPPNQFSSVNVISTDSQQLLRSCISSAGAEEGKRKEGKRKKKKVQFAQDVVDPTGNSEEYRRKLLRKQQLHYYTSSNNNNNSSSSTSGSSEKEEKEGVDSVLCNKKRVSNSSSKGGERMPANRAALYNGILRERVLHRVAFSF